MNSEVKEGCECKDKDEVKESNSSSLEENKKVMEEWRARRERVEAVQELLSAVHYKTSEDKDAAILSFTKCALSIPEIEQLIKPLRSDYLAGQIYKKGVM